MTDLTYTCVRNNRTISTKGSDNINQHTKNLNNTSERKEKYQNYSTYSSQNNEKNTSFVKPFISNSEQDVIPVVQTKNISSLGNEDDKQNVKTNMTSPSSSRKSIKLKDVLQEDKLNIIINNLADRNCSQKYIDKIIEMFDCLDYVVSYKTESECNNDSVVSYETSNSEIIPQQSLVCDDNRANTNKLENKLTELKNYGHSTDLGYGSIRNDSNAIQLSNPVNIKIPEHDKSSDNSENETYAGVPKISIERVLKARETSRKIYKRKVRKKTIYPDASKHASNLPFDTEEVMFESIHIANPVTNTKKNSLPEESCVSITDDEVEIMSDTRECRKTIKNITQRPQEMTFSSHRDIQRNNFVYGEGKSATHVQNKPFNVFEPEKVKSNIFIKEQKTPYGNIQENAHSQFVTDVDYTINSDIDVVTISTNSQKTGDTITSRDKADQDIVITSEKKSNSEKSNLEKSCAVPKLHREFVEQTKSETTMKKSKPTIISSMPVNLNLKITRVRDNNLRDSKVGQPQNSKIIVKNEDKQNANIRPLEEIDKKKSTLKMSAATKSVINDSHSKTTTAERFDNKREICPITNNKSESNNMNPTNNINPTNSTTNPINEQSKSDKLGVEENPKVLTAWTPKVVYYAKSRSELGLTFQGKLLK